MHILMLIGIGLVVLAAFILVARSLNGARRGNHALAIGVALTEIGRLLKGQYNALATQTQK
jgi:hypothetical protein